MKKLISIIIGFILMSGSVAVLDLAKPQVAEAIAIREIVGMGADSSTTPIPACSTFGYSINTSVNTGLATHSGNGLLVDDLNNRLYAILINTATGIDPRIFIYDLDLTFINAINVPEDAVNEFSGAGFGRGGTVGNANGKLRVFYRRPLGASPACLVGVCMGSRGFNGNFQESDTDYLSTQEVGLLACTFEDSNSQIYCFRGATGGGADRRVAAFDGDAVLLTSSFGTPPNTGENTPITSDSTNVYGVRDATDELWSMTRAAGVVSTTSITMGANRMGMLVDAGATISDGDDGTDIIIAMDNNVTTATLSRVTKSSFTETQTLSMAAADGGTGGNEQNGLLFDDVNVTIHSVRVGGATNMIRRIGFTPTLSLQNIITRGTCTAAVAGSTCNPGPRLATDYSRTNAAVYVLTSENSARVIKIDVCATGGP